MKLSNTERLMTFAATALAAMAVHAAPETTDTITPATTPLIHTATVVVRDTVYRYIVVPAPALKSMTDVTKYQTKYEKKRSQRIGHWLKLIPNQFTLQYAGSIGMLSAGPGWHYGKKEHWETDILFGFLPRYHSEKGKFTFTVKERYVPWHCRFSNRWTLQPLTAGVAFNTLSGDDFWRNLPDKYPHNYYWFSTKLRTLLFLGQRIRYDIPDQYRRYHSSITAYYEISTCDFYALSKYSNREYPWSKVLSLAFGIRWEM